MPFYTYKHTTDSHCETCENGFEMLQRMNAEPVAYCPDCGYPVKKVISAPNIAVGVKHLTTDKTAEQKGFTKYKRAGKGVYEKTAGKGPKYISGD